MLIEFLNDYYTADFKKIHDIAGNQHLVGHSVRFDKDLFVKIFTESEMFYAEQNVNQVYCPEIYLDSVIFGDKYIVVLIDRELMNRGQLNTVGCWQGFIKKLLTRCLLQTIRRRNCPIES